MTQGTCLSENIKRPLPNDDNLVSLYTCEKSNQPYVRADPQQAAAESRFQGSGPLHVRHGPRWRGYVWKASPPQVMTGEVSDPHLCNHAFSLDGLLLLYTSVELYEAELKR